MIAAALRRLRERSRQGDETARLATNSAWAFAGAAIAAVALFAEAVVLARYLSPSGFGVYVLIIAFPEAVQQLLDFRSRDTMTRYLATFMAEGRRRDAVAVVKLIWLVDLAVSVAALLIVLATASVAAGLLVGDESRGSLMAIYAAGLFLGSLDSASGSVLRVLDRFRLASTVGGGVALGRLAIVVVVVAMGGGLAGAIWARVAAHVLTSVVQGGVTLHVLGKTLGDERRAPISVLRAQYGEIRGFMVSTNLTGVLRMAATKLDTMLVGLLATPATVGFYKLALQMGSVLLYASDSLFSAVFPSFSRLHAQQRGAEIRHIAWRASKALAVVVIPATLLIAAASQSIVVLVAGEKFSAAGPVLAICVAGMAPYTIFFWAYPLLLATGHPNALLRVTAVQIVVQLTTIALLVPQSGAIGAAIAVALASGIGIALQLRVVRNRGLLDS